MIDKIKDLQLNNEFRIIFDYFRIIKLIFNAHLKLFSKIYNHLFNSRYECLFLADFKYAYFTISLYLNN